jgi:phospholipid/cholesterol/gamma-HCH transport system permease protein
LSNEGNPFLERKQLKIMMIIKWLTALGRYIMLMGRTFSVPERFRMFWKQYIKEMAQLGVNSIGIVLLISFFIGAVICIQMKLNIESPWMPRWVAGYTTREIMLLEFSSSIMCLILAGKVGSNIASEIGTMRVTQQIDALDIMGVNSASYLILPKIAGMLTIMPALVVFSSVMGIIGAYATAYIGHIMPPDDLRAGIQHDFQSWFMWMSIIKSLFFAFIISSVPSYFGYTVEGGSVNVGKASTDAVVSSSALILFSDVFLTQLLS